jgi:hypothetical protein
VMVFQCPCGTRPTSRSPRGQRPLSRTIFVLAAVSSMNTNRALGETTSGGRLTATLIFDGTKILVRADQQNNVARLVPTADNPEIGYILNAISAEFGVTFVADHEEAGLFLAGELA